MDLVIIGGGAAGMMAALTAAEWLSDADCVTLLERQPRLGRKLLATGNGRCNLSNTHCAPSRYHGGDPDFVRPALEQFGVADTLDWFRRLGLLCRTEPGGRVYPFSDQANSVLDTLRLALDATGVLVRTDCPVSAVTRRKKRFLLTVPDGTVYADRLIVTAGGAAAPKLGGSMDGYQLLRELGHRRTKLYPSLVQLRTDTTYTRSLKGVRAEAAVTLLRNKEILAQQSGEVQFTDYGISGPVIFDLSRAAVTGGHGLTARLDLLPDLSERELTALLAERCRRFPGLTLENLLTGTLHNRLGRTVLRYGGRKLSASVRDLTHRDLAAIAGDCKGFHLPVTGDMGLEHAQVTAGGLRTEEFDPDTLQSRLCPGLYAAGEILDVDGDCGGFNLQWAWSSGHLAGLLRV